MRDISLSPFALADVSHRFCVDSDVSRIEEADRRTFETIAKYSNTVPVFVVGTKKDKLIAYRKMLLLEEYMQKTNNYQESIRLANVEAGKLADEQFATLRGELSRIKSYKVDGYICISKSTSLTPPPSIILLSPRIHLYPIRYKYSYVHKRNNADDILCR